MIGHQSLPHRYWVGVSVNNMLEYETIIADDDVFYLYEVPDGKGTPYTETLSYRGRAQFWAYVAETLQKRLLFDSKKVLGVIGGRSGSMDLPSFVGVRCLSWDEPIFQIPNAEVVAEDPLKMSIPAKETVWSSYWVAQQARQILRLLGQRDLMHVTFLDRNTINIEKLPGDRTRRAYNALEANDRRLHYFLDPSKIGEPPLYSLGYKPNPLHALFLISKYRIPLERRDPTALERKVPVPNIVSLHLNRFTNLAGCQCKQPWNKLSSTPTDAEAAERIIMEISVPSNDKSDKMEIDEYGTMFGHEINIKVDLTGE